MSGRGRGGSGRGGRGRGRGGGRGEYYKNKYGGGRGSNANDKESSSRSGGNNGGFYEDLISILHRIDNKSYPAYHDIESFEEGWFNRGKHPFKLLIGRAQSDPYARPTSVRIFVPCSTAQFPKYFHENSIRSTALADYLHRAFHAACLSMGADQAAQGKGWSGPKGGDISISPPSQHVLKQSAVWVDPGSGDVTAQFTVNLPARGRTILGSRAIDIFDRIVPNFVSSSFIYSALNSSKLEKHILSVEDQDWLRKQLSSRNLVAFVPNGAILPRLSGADDRPMSDLKNSNVVRFQSPESLEVTFNLPSTKTKLKGMGIKKGVTLIVGGGFHGKSTLLSALQYGIYDKMPGDGREFCVCDENAVKIRAEDGRSVSSVDISPFIQNLPFGKQTNNFSTMDASGSTSQAANIIEALEVGAKTFLIDEDTCATNFMIRDDKMMELVASDKEPITPFIQKVRSLYDDHGVSSILVVGGSGDYFDVSDTVVMMDSYKCIDATIRAKEIFSLKGSNIQGISFGKVTQRSINGAAFQPNNKVNVRSKSVVSYGDIELDLSGCEQIAQKAQTEAIVSIIMNLSTLTSNKTQSLENALSTVYLKLETDGFDVIGNSSFHGGLAMPRKFELAAAMNRLRSNGTFSQK